MNKVVSIIVIVLILMLSTVSAIAGKKEDAKYLVSQAVAYALANGLEKTYEKMRESDSPFRKGDLYVWACLEGETSIITCHPVKKAMEGKNFNNLKDNKGKFIFVEAQKVIKEKGEGWTSYWWPKPGEKKYTQKYTYLMSVKGMGVFFGCGYYE